ncbi:unnamed protein product [Adineta steineri]|uniref:CCR4-NOT transcription complex subunit 11 n=1 Tax=Adineta steineri TaxID=433720 RepID=A0A813UHI6_9BILA|nr:unnamed protein product [Adineta steineri]
MSLSSKDINLILNFLNEETCGSSLTFEQISAQFQHNISKSDYLRVGNALVLLLQNRDLIPTPQQRLIILFLFNDMYKSEQQSIHMNPFAPVFISILQNLNGENFSTQKHFHWLISPVTQHERWFVKTLINNSSSSNNNLRDFIKKTPNQILQSGLSTINDNNNNGKEELKEKIQEHLQQLPVLVQCHLPAVIDDPEINYYGFDTLIGGPRQRSNDSRQTIERLLSNNAMEQTIRPEFLRLVPPLHECTIDELVWLSPIDYDPSLFTWDSTMCIPNTTNNEIRQLMEKAYQGVLNLQQQQKLLDEIDNDPNIVYHIGLVPSKLPILVENSPLISIQCLLKLISSNQMTEYLSSLLNMDMSLHSMEVVNRLSTSMKLPQEFLHLYISTCIKTCEETKDKYLQNRFVRLVSVFIQSLIRNKAIDIKDLFLDIQGFCINFRHIKEAGALFQLVKSFELRNNDNNDTIASSSTTTTTISTQLIANDE